MNSLSLFSGGGLGDLGLMMAGIEISGQCEIDDYCQKILNLRWPNVPKWRDIRNVTGKEVFEKSGTIDLISGGFPCQPFSSAGKQRGREDNRYLWPEMLRVISEVKPTWVLGENVSGIVKHALDQVLSDLEGQGYACQAFIIPACAYNAPHRRDRVWIVGYSQHNGQLAAEVKRSSAPGGNDNQTGQEQASQPERSSQQHKNVANTGRQSERNAGKGFNFEWLNSGPEKFGAETWDRFADRGWWAVEPGMGRVANGVPGRVDRLKMLGNGQVTFAVKWIAERIKKCHEMNLIAKT